LYQLPLHKVKLFFQSADFPFQAFKLFFLHISTPYLLFIQE
jgi:hypothetical protein